MIDSSPSTNLYTLGRGIVSLAEWTGETFPTVWRDVGNCSKFDVEITEEQLVHTSSRSGTKKKDKIAVLETGYNVSFELDEVSVENLAVALKATVSSGSILLANVSLSKEYGIKFVSDNPYGPNQRWIFRKARLAPGAAFPLIGNTWTKLAFKADGLEDATEAASPFFSVWFVTTTTST